MTIAWMLMFSLSIAVSGEKSATVAPATYKLLQRAEQLIDKSAYADALSTLNTMLPEVADSSLDKAVILRSVASVYAQQGKYKQAAQALEQCLATKALPIDQAGIARLNLGELYASAGEYKKSAGLLDGALRQVKAPTSQQYYMLASVYAQLKQYKKSAVYMRKAIAKKRNADESWYKTLLAMLYQAGNYKEGVTVLNQLIQKFPQNKEYWLQLIAMHQQINQYKQALVVNELAYREGLIRSRQEIINLANLMSHQDAPYRAAELLQKEIAAGRLKNTSGNWRMVSNVWVQAREFDRAATALKKASVLDPTGEIDFSLGRIYVEQEKWKEAHAQLLTAIKKGGLKDPGNTHLLFGISCYELHFDKTARESFIKAQQYKHTRKTGRQWVNYIDSEG